jgi:GTP-binding protein
MRAEFVLSAPRWEALPELACPELAITGRSNVGKSSLLGTLLAQPKLVRTSRTPGRTQLLNLFMQGEQLAWVDLPGYGYAKLSRSERTRMHGMARGYLAQRRNLNGVLLLVDARREGVSTTDCEMAQWVLEHNRPLLVVATKADLVPKNRRMGQMRRIEGSLGVPRGGVLAASSHTGEGMDALRKRIWDLVGTTA